MAVESVLRVIVLVAGVSLGSLLAKRAGDSLVQAFRSEGLGAGSDREHKKRGVLLGFLAWVVLFTGFLALVI